MTPSERLDQLEPLLADGSQKIDRLIEGQSQIIGEVSKIPGMESRMTGIETRMTGIETRMTGMETRMSGMKSDITKTAEAVAKLTVSTQRQYEELTVGQETIMQYLREKLP